MTLSEYIKILQGLESTYGDSTVAMTQDTTREDGPYAELYLNPKKVTVEYWLDRKMIRERVLQLGHSTQRTIVHEVTQINDTWSDPGIAYRTQQGQL